MSNPAASHKRDALEISTVTRFRMKKPPKHKPVSNELKGWQEIATFLSQPVAVAKRWAGSEGMPTEWRRRQRLLHAPFHYAIPGVHVGVERFLRFSALFASPGTRRHSL